MNNGNITPRTCRKRPIHSIGLNRGTLNFFILLICSFAVAPFLLELIVRFNGPIT